MTFEELNIVRKLKKQIAKEEQKLQGFKDLAMSITPQFSRTTHREGKKEISYTCLDTQPKGNSIDSRIEMIAILIADTEKNIKKLNIQLEKESSLLIKKIVENFPDGIRQRILFNHYIIGKSFREIARIMCYSLAHIFKIHSNVLESLKEDS